MSKRNEAVSAVVRQRRRGFPRGNPCRILTVVFMLVLVVWSHVIFHRLTIVDLPHQESTSTSLPHNNVSRYQTEIRSRQTSGERLNVSITTPGSLTLTTTELRQSINRDRSDSRIIIRSDNNVIKPAATGRLEAIEMAASDVSDDVYPTDAGARQQSQPMRRRQGIRDRDGLANWKWRQSHLLTNNHSLAPISPTSTSATSSPRFVGSVAYSA